MRVRTCLRLSVRCTQTGASYRQAQTGSRSCWSGTELKKGMLQAMCLPPQVDFLAENYHHNRDLLIESDNIGVLQVSLGRYSNILPYQAASFF